MAGCWLAALAACAQATAGQPAFALVAAGDVPEHRLTRESASFIFKRKQGYWRGGARIQPVNLPADNALRLAVSRCLFGQAPEAMEAYWREMYFHGTFPPYVLASEAAVLLFVATTPGAIGYVSACPPDGNLKVVFVIGDAPNCPKPTASCAPLQE